MLAFGVICATSDGRCTLVLWPGYNVKRLLLQREEEGASFADFGFHPGVAAVEFGNFPHDRKSDACTIDAIARRERLEYSEDLLGMPLVDSGSVVGDAEFPENLQDIPGAFTKF